MIKQSYIAHRETFYNFIWRSLQIFGKQGITFLIFIISAKLLSPYEFGIYNYVLAIIFLLIIFGDFGISVATSKYVAEYNATNKDKLKSILFNSGVVIIGLTIIVIILTLTLGPIYLKEKYSYVLYLLPLLFLAPITSLYDGIYRGLKRFKSLAIISLSVGLVSLSFVYILIKTYGLVGALISQSLFYFILFLVLGIGYRDFHLKLNKEVIKEIGGYAFLIGIANISFFMYTRADIIILGKFNYITEIGYYEILNKILLILLLPSAILGDIIAPRITSLYATNNKELVYKKFKKYFGYFLALGIAMTLLVYLALPYFISIFLPKYYVSSFKIMFLLFFIILPTRIIGTFMVGGFITPSGFAKIVSINTFIFGILNILLDITLISLFGFLGVIYSTLLLNFISFTIRMALYHKKIKNSI